MTLRSALARRLMPRLVAGALPAWLAGAVHRWVREDAALSALYDAARRAEGDDKLSAAQLDLIEALVLDAGGDHERLPRRLRIPLVAGGALAATTALLFVVAQPANDDERIRMGNLAARGQKIASAPLGVKITCLSADTKSVLDEATAGARQSGARLDCPLGSVLAFSTTNLSQDARHLFIVGIAADGARRFYSPFDEHGAALQMKPGAADALLTTLADTKNMPKDEDVSLFVLVSDETFDAAEIERQLARAESRGVPLKSVDRLPLDVPVQSRIDMHHDVGGR